MQNPGSSNRSSNFVILVVVLAAYLPALVGPGLTAYSPAQIALLLGLGLLYLLLATVGFNTINEELPARYLPAYFLLMIPLTILIFYLGNDFSNGIWLLILPVVAQTVGLPRPQLIAANIIYLALLVLSIIAGGATGPAVLQFTVSMVAGMVFTLVFTNLAVREQTTRLEVERLAQELTTANEQLRAYSVQIEELATTRERNRLAREIHDSIGHSLTAVNVQLAAAQAVMDRDPQKAQQALSRAQALTQEGLAEVRRSVAAFRESPLTGRPLSAAIQPLIDETRAAGILATFHVQGPERELERRAALTLYRAAQEGLTNVRKHAHASRVDLLLNYSDPAGVRLQIVDNGVGCADLDGAAVPGAGFGLVGLRERVALIGGELRTDSQPGGGFTLSVRLPSGE